MKTKYIYEHPILFELGVIAMMLLCSYLLASWHNSRYPVTQIDTGIQPVSYSDCLRVMPDNLDDVCEDNLYVIK